jgi:hypothetical protein
MISGIDIKTAFKFAVRVFEDMLRACLHDHVTTDRPERTCACNWRRFKPPERPDDPWMTRRARRVLAQHGITHPPEIDVETLARKLYRTELARIAGENDARLQTLCWAHSVIDRHIVDPSEEQRDKLAAFKRAILDEWGSLGAHALGGG